VFSAAPPSAGLPFFLIYRPAFPLRGREPSTEWGEAPPLSIAPLCFHPMEPARLAVLLFFSKETCPARRAQRASRQRRGCRRSLRHCGELSEEDRRDPGDVGDQRATARDHLQDVRRWRPQSPAAREPRDLEIRAAQPPRLTRAAPDARRFGE